MKRILFVSLLGSFVVFSLWACGIVQPGPRGVAKDFLQAVQLNDFKTAKEFVSNDSKSALEMYAAGKALAKKGAKPDIKIKSIVREANQATVYYLDRGTEKMLEMKKVNGEWKAIFVKPGKDQESE